MQCMHCMVLQQAKEEVTVAKCIEPKVSDHRWVVHTIAAAPARAAAAAATVVAVVIVVVVSLASPVEGAGSKQ